MFQIAFQTFTTLSRSAHPRLVLEMMLVRLSAIEPMLPIEPLIERLEKLEHSLPEVSAPTPELKTLYDSIIAGLAPPPVVVSPEKTEKKTPQVVFKSEFTNPLPKPPEVTIPAPLPKLDSPSEQVPANNTQEIEKSKKPIDLPKEEDPPVGKKTTGLSILNKHPDLANTQKAPTPQAAPKTTKISSENKPEHKASEKPLTEPNQSAEFVQRWYDFVLQLKEEGRSLGGYLIHARPLQFSPESCRIVIKDSTKELLEDLKLTQLKNQLEQEMGKPVPLTIISEESFEGAEQLPMSLADKEQARIEEIRTTRKEQILNNTGVVNIKEIFNPVETIARVTMPEEDSFYG